jgi:REP element-mobilizing transposase RayT
VIPSLGVMESLLNSIMKNIDPFEVNHFYHIFNKTINKEKLFYSNRNYPFFLKRYKNYLSEYLDTYSYCLIPNHFHLLARLKPDLDSTKDIDKKITDQFRKFFISYVQSINKEQDRTGSLLQKKFKRKRIKNKAHLLWAIYYIHKNPIHHNLDTKFENYRWSSYRTLSEKSSKNTALKKEEVLKLFGGQSAFTEFHRKNLEMDKKYNYLVLE